MDLKSTIVSSFLLLLLALPHLPTGRFERAADSEIYEIDYRGPETHSSAMPPPGHRGHYHGINSQNAMSFSPKSTGSSNSNQLNDKKIHG